MFLDASAIVAVLAREPEADAILDRIEARRGALRVSPLVRFEATLALARTRSGRATAADRPDAERLGRAAKLVDEFLGEIGASEMVITTEIGDAALGAAAAYGRTVGHPADLNFGDCFAYACAKVSKVGLIYKGNDFAQTDLA